MSVSTTKWLIYKGSGGLFHNLSGLFFALNCAKSQSRKIIIDTDKHPAFGVRFSDYFCHYCPGIDIYFDYNEINKTKEKALTYKSLNLKDIEDNRALFNNGRYYLMGHPLLNFSDKIDPKLPLVVISTWDRIDHIDYRQIKVHNRVFDRLKLEPTPDSPYISIHFRNTDISNDIAKFVEKIKDIRKKKPINVLYVASDDSNVYSHLQKTFPDMKILRYTKPPEGIKNLHYSACDKDKQMYECLRDLYLILKSDYFIPSLNSNVSLALIRMIETKEYIFPFGKNFSPPIVYK